MTERPAGRRRLGDASGEGGPMLSTGSTGVSHGSDGAAANRSAEKRLRRTLPGARNVGFRVLQTLERFELLVRAKNSSSPVCLCIDSMA